jgi:hypothetical protein
VKFDHYNVHNRFSTRLTLSAILRQKNSSPDRSAQLTQPPPLPIDIERFQGFKGSGPTSPSRLSDPRSSHHSSSSTLFFEDEQQSMSRKKSGRNRPSSGLPAAKRSLKPFKGNTEPVKLLALQLSSSPTALKREGS